jgi:hypothetical protein
MQESEKTFVVAFLIAVGVVLEIMSLRVDDMKEADNPVSVYKSSINRERMHNAASTVLLTAVVAQLVFQSTN